MKPNVVNKVVIDNDNDMTMAMKTIFIKDKDNL